MKPHSDISIYRKTRLAVIHRYGEMSLEQLIDGVDALYSNPDFDDTTSIISDLSRASLAVTGEEITKHAEYCKKLLGASNNKIAIVAPDAVDFGLSRMFEILSELPNVMVVKTLSEAYEQLGIPMEGLADSESEANT